MKFEEFELFDGVDTEGGVFGVAALVVGLLVNGPPLLEEEEEDEEPVSLTSDRGTALFASTYEKYLLL